MAHRTIRLLHVEDDPVQQRLVPIHLRKLQEYRFAITRAVSEDEAVDAFQRDGADLVLLDYHLTQGNGLNVLRRIRRLDPVVPVIAMSGEATAQVAADLIRSGADDYIQKTERADRMIASVQTALLRHVQIQQRLTTPGSHPARVLEECLVGTCVAIVDGPCAALMGPLDELERRAREANLSRQEFGRLFQTVCDAYDKARPGTGVPGWRLLRPVWLELCERLFRPHAGQSGFMPSPTDNAG